MQFGVIGCMHTSVIFYTFCNRPMVTLLSNLAAQYPYDLAPTDHSTVESSRLMLYFRWIIHKTCLGITARNTPFWEECYRLFTPKTNVIVEWCQHLCIGNCRNLPYLQLKSFALVWLAGWWLETKFKPFRKACTQNRQQGKILPPPLKWGKQLDSKNLGVVQQLHVTHVI